MTPGCPLRRSSRSLRWLLFVVLVAVAPIAAQAATHVVELSNFAVDPAALTIVEGDSVEWRIVSGRHSSTAKDGGWNSGELGEDITFTQRFDVAGVYPYFCTPHDFMRGTITVLPGPSIWQRWSTWLVAGVALLLIAAGTVLMRGRRA
jgi:plastocyanin